MSRVSVIIPNFDGEHLLPACLDALARQTRPPDEIVVVDDASTDGSCALMRRRYPQARLLTLPTNNGFCRAANAGLRAAQGDILALLNNDAEPHPAWLAEATAALEHHPQAGFCATKMLFHDRRDLINSAGLFLRVDGVGRDVGYGQPDGPVYSAPGEVFGSSGGAAIYRRAMLDDVGLFDEDLVAYAEDLDLSFRAQLRGWTCLYVPTALVYHRGGTSYGPTSAAAVYYGSRNMAIVLLKNMPVEVARRHWPKMLAAQVYQVAYNCRCGRGWPALRGKLAALASMRNTLAKRRRIQRARRVTDEHIEAILSPWREHGRYAPRS